MIVRIPSNSYSREVEEGKVDMRAGRDKKVIEKKSYWMMRFCAISESIKYLDARFQLDTRNI